MNTFELLLFRFRLWRIRWGSWEYWPFWAAVAPLALIYLWFALRLRRLFFISTVNPAIPLGGSFGESKSDILRLLPSEALPRSVFIRGGAGAEQVFQQLTEAGISFPVIAKPDVGERGFLVKKINDPTTLADHLSQFRVDFIVQEFLEHPLEFSVLFYRIPGDRSEFGISSVCQKEFLSVKGDGRSSIRQLMKRQPRAALQLGRFEQEKPELLTEIPADGEFRRIETIGNHCKGTAFLNANHLIDQHLHAAFEPLCSQLDGVFYGRFDLKSASIEALKRGEVKIMELNGVLSDPAHVFDPAHGIWRAYRDYYRHWRIISRISRANRQQGMKDASWREVYKLWKEYQLAKQAPR